MKPLTEPLPLEEARSRFSYDPLTGIIIREKAHHPHRVGTAAGCIHHTGYCVIKIGVKQILAQRLAWFLFYGEWPGDLFIDHINHNKLDNRIANLRKATNRQNIVNSRKCRNRTGFKGVQFNARNKTGKKWFSTIAISGWEKYLGSYKTAEEAYAAFRRAAIEVHGEFAETAQ